MVNSFGNVHGLCRWMLPKNLPGFIGCLVKITNHYLLFRENQLAGAGVLD
jgi:hypothetical protein